MVGPFQRLDEIGKGSFANVYKGRHMVCCCFVGTHHGCIPSHHPLPSTVLCRGYFALSSVNTS